MAAAGPGFSAPAHYPPALTGEGLELRPWDRETLRAAAHWQDYAFPFHAYNLSHLRDPANAERMLQAVSQPGKHLHFAAVERGRPVGRVSVNLGDSAGLYIWSVHVPPEHQGRGVCRRMLTVLMAWLERAHPGRDFVLNSTTFAEHAHRAYFALGFRITETIWHHDREIAEALWRASAADRRSLDRHLRFVGGRWEVRTFVMRRRRHTPMDTGTPGAAAGYGPAMSIASRTSTTPKTR